MFRQLSLSSIRRAPRLFILAAFAFVGAVSATSCLTPDATFSQGDGDANLGGQNGDGDSTTGHCSNRRIDADETDIDCGGRDCDPCALGRKCDAGSDCVNGTCTAGRCQMPSCTDGVKNSSETDEDCGGDGCPPCADGKRCEQNKDCESASCKGGFCAEPACNDRIKNGTESDVDCGGSCEPCESGSDCVLNADCVQPPTSDPATSICDDGICVLTCPDGFGDCNNKASDGCETDVGTSMSHCGSCGAACAPSHAVGMCQGGNCLIDREAPDTTGGCLGNWRDCNNGDDDGCEANINNHASTCGSCETPCSSANGTASCSSGQCSIVCNEGFSNCDEDARSNGCEINTNTNAAHCSACGEVCDDANPGESPACAAGTCSYTLCPSGFGDCNGDGNCNDNLTTVSNCGGCGNSCSVANGTPACVNQGGGNYACDVQSCSSGGGAVWNDCNDSYVDGCEVNTQSNKFRCGGCLSSDPNAGSGQNCDAILSNITLRVTATECSAGGCRIVSCSAGYADCNGVFADGCEINLTNNKNHCGGCTSGPTTTWNGGFVCDNLYANATGSCSNSTCSFNQCNTDYGDCNGDAALGSAGNGCETYLVSNTSHCGVCANMCVTNVQTSSNTCTASSNRACSPTCSNTSLYGNCDSNPSNGCETLLQSTTAHCGTCGNNCGSSVGTNNISGVGCTTGSCRVTTCNSGRADCDGTFSNGCEINTTNNANHCGGCQSGPTTTWDGGANCTSSVGSNGISGVTCASSSCAVTTCSAGLADCDGTFSNGCEINTTNNVTHCGGCTSGPTTTWDGGATCANKTNATRSCVSGGCVWTCQAGWKDSNGDLQNAVSNGCERAIIGIINSNTTATGSTNGDLSFTHNLQTSNATNNKRAVVLILGNNSNDIDLPPPVTYNGQPMTMVVETWFNQASVQIYYILNSSLPTNPTTATIFVDGNANNTMRWTAQVLELTNIDQSAPVGHFLSQGAGGSACNANLTVNTNTDAMVVSGLVTQGDDTFGALSGQNVLSELFFVSTNSIVGYFLEVPAGTRQVRWSCSDSEWAHAVVAFNPEGTD
jgi:hypothetical protein